MNKSVELIWECLPKLRKASIHFVESLDDEYARDVLFAIHALNSVVTDFEIGSDNRRG